ncbi:hypothetical protein PCANB_002260 [Pneumocystis canis]|nr:hypothetical protein PCANB_002260 [Pneumocystis canis]
MEKKTNYEVKKQCKYILYASVAFLGLGVIFSFKYTKVKPSDLSANSILFGLKALGISTFICFGTFGLGIITVSKTLKVKNVEEFSDFMKNYAKTSFRSLKITSNESDYDNINESM